MALKRQVKVWCDRCGQLNAVVEKGPYGDIVREYHRCTNPVPGPPDFPRNYKLDDIIFVDNSKAVETATDKADRRQWAVPSANERHEMKKWRMEPLIPSSDSIFQIVDEDGIKLGGVEAIYIQKEAEWLLSLINTLSGLDHAAVAELVEWCEAHALDVLDPENERHESPPNNKWAKFGSILVRLRPAKGGQQG